MGVRVKLDARMAELPFARGGAVFSYCRLSIALRITTSNLHRGFVVVIFTGGRRPGRDNHVEWIRLLTPPADWAML